MASLGTRTSRTQDDAEGGELNVVPYLDVLMNLIVFMLLSVAGLSTLGVVPATALGAARTGPDSAPATPRCAITPVGFSVWAAGATGDEDAALAATEIPLTADGRYDYPALSRALSALQASNGGGSRLVLAPAPRTPLEIVVATMDAARETPEHRRLFPEVTLAGR